MKENLRCPEMPRRLNFGYLDVKFGVFRGA